MSRSLLNRKSLARAVAATLAAYSGAGLASPTTGSPYYSDTQSTHVEDATSKGIGTVNMIACVLHALAPDQLVNKGNYVALIDENACDPNARDSSSQSGASGGAQTSYTTTVVNRSEERRVGKEC